VAGYSSWAAMDSTYILKSNQNWLTGKSAGVKRVDERLGNSPRQGSRELLVKQGWKTPGELGVSLSMECDNNNKQICIAP